MAARKTLNDYFSPANQAQASTSSGSIPPYPDDDDIEYEEYQQILIEEGNETTVIGEPGFQNMDVASSVPNKVFTSIVITSYRIIAR